MVANVRFYTDKYGNEWMAYDTEPSYCMPSRRSRIMLPRNLGGRKSHD